MRHLKTHFDSTVPEIKVVPQDIGRVLLNIINNAFYAVSEKSKAESSKADTHYGCKKSPEAPQAWATWWRLKSQTTAMVSPEHIKEKFSNPFYHQTDRAGNRFGTLFII
ncbi:MAG: hypothetical protein IPN49_16730 [Saprospiraceae bacterium]|nr:hypothetical protein [Saprospiraceae bacterium]